MKLLILDKMQTALDAPSSLVSPSLADTYTVSNIIPVNFSGPVVINCIGLGNTDATQIQISDGVTVRIIDITDVAPIQNGLYLLDTITYQTPITFTHNGSYIGRIAVGEYKRLCTSVTKETGFYTTNENRETLSGNIVSGSGGYFGRRLDLDVRYKITEEIYDDIYGAYLQIMKNYPYFIDLGEEQHKLPQTMQRLHAITSQPISLLQSSVYDFLYSYKFNFLEKF